MPVIKMSFQEFLEQCIMSEPSRTRGRAIHNMLAQVRKDLWKSIRDTDLDPLEDDRRIKSCLDWLEAHW